MKILFYGNKGWIGGMIKTYYPAYDELIDSDVRLIPENKNKIKNELDNVKPDLVVCTVGRTSGWSLENPDEYIPNIDYLEQDGKIIENLNDNLYAPLFLAIECMKRDIHMTYMGTGCIFSSDTNNTDKKYTEQDHPDFFGSQYSTVKGYTDQIIGELPNVLNLRIRMPITSDWNPKNFVTKITKFKQICSYKNSMTYLPDLIPVMIYLSKKRFTGTLNFVNPGTISHEEILEMFKKHVNPDHHYELIDQRELSSVLVAKRSNNHLSTTLLQDVYPYPVRNIHQCIEGWFASEKKQC
jgi:dTDP-4-dehydrorhamnose reductase